MSGTLTVSHSVYASVAHRYWNSEWSHEKNLQVYGSDSSPEGIGSNLRLELAVRLAALTGERTFLPALNEIKSLVDHQCLFAADSALGSKASTLENIGFFLAGHLFGKMPPGGEPAYFTVWESERLACTVRPGQSEVSMRFRKQNLTLEISGSVNMESGIAVDRAVVTRAINELYVKLNEIHQQDTALWSKVLFLRLSQSITGLKSLQIDLGRHESVVVHS